MGAFDQPEEQPPGAPMWMVSYGDMVTLLLCFFVLLFAMSKIDNQKVIGLLESLSQTFNPKSAKAELDPTGPITDPHILGQAQLVPLNGQTAPILPNTNQPRGAGRSRVEEDLETIANAVAALAADEKLEQQLKVEVNGRGVVISFAEVARDLENVAPFDSGSARLRPEFKRVLDRLAPVLRQTTNKIEVQGHTDPRPIHSLAFPSNWELSGARAGSVVRYLTEGHALWRRQFVCAGFADTVPVDPANNPEAWARNRRIEIVITRQPIDTYDKLSRVEAAQQPADITAPIGQPFPLGEGAATPGRRSTPPTRRGPTLAKTFRRGQ